MSKRYPASQWRTWLSACQQSDLTVVKFCESIGVSVNTYYRWRDRLKGESSNSQQTETGDRWRVLCWHYLMARKDSPGTGTVLKSWRKHLETTMVAPNCSVTAISMVQLSWGVSGRMQNPNNKYPAFNSCWATACWAESSRSLRSSVQDYGWSAPGRIIRLMPSTSFRSWKLINRPSGISNNFI